MKSFHVLRAALVAALWLPSGIVFAQTAAAPVKQNAAADIISIDTLARKKVGMSDEAFDRYWTNVHALLATSALGFDEYWTHRFAPVKTDLFPNLSGIRYDVSPAEQFSGSAQVTINAAPRMQALFQNPTTPLILEDEQNLFSQSKVLAANPGNSLLLKNAVVTNAVQGKNAQPTYQVYLQKADAATVDTFRQFVKDTFAPAFAGAKETAKVNVHLLEPYSDAVWPSPKVDHSWDAAKTYQAYIEIVFTDDGVAKAFFASPAYKATEAGQRRFLKAIHVYPVRETYTFILNSAPTLTGLRGAAAATAIREANAQNQMRPDVLKQVVSEKLIQP